ncbi:MAG TPA: hypothetical protein VIT23_08430, partial [Terrimicrobiaceae bacterium]
PATEQNVAMLRTRHVEFIGPEAGMLACGYEGLGRLWNVEDILAKAEGILLREPKTPAPASNPRKKSSANLKKFVD